MLWLLLLPWLLPLLLLLLLGSDPPFIFNSFLILSPYSGGSFEAPRKYNISKAPILRLECKRKACSGDGCGGNSRHISLFIREVCLI